MGKPVGLGELDTVTAVDADHPGEPGLGSDPIDRILQLVHAVSVLGDQARDRNRQHQRYLVNEPG